MLGLAPTLRRQPRALPFPRWAFGELHLDELVHGRAYRFQGQPFIAHAFFYLFVGQQRPPPFL